MIKACYQALRQREREGGLPQQGSLPAVGGRVEVVWAELIYLLVLGFVSWFLWRGDFQGPGWWGRTPGWMIGVYPTAPGCKDDTGGWPQYGIV